MPHTDGIIIVIITSEESSYLQIKYFLKFKL